jgi:hypothetical protein
MKMLPLRFPPSVHERVAALVGVISEDEGFEAHRITQSSVLRMALLEGLKLLEERYRDKSS